jgi:hypothetical protein
MEETDYSIGYMAVIEDSMPQGNLTLYKLAWREPFSNEIIFIHNGSEVSTPCLTAALLQYQAGVYSYTEYLEAVKACIDTYFDGPEPDDPDPPGWDPTGPYSRPAFIRYWLLIGLFLVLGPPLLFAYKREFSDIPVYVFIMLIGVSFLISLLYM